MAISRLSGQDATGSGTTTASATYASTATAGNLLIAVIGIDNGSPISTITGFTKARENVVASQQAAIFYKVSDGTETVISTSGDPGDTVDIAIYEYTGINRALVDVTATGGDGITAVLSVTSGTTARPAVDNEVAIACGYWQTVTQTFASATNGFSLRSSVGSHLFTVDKINTVRPGIGIDTTITVTGTSSGALGVIVYFMATTYHPILVNINGGSRIRPAAFSPGLAR